MKLVVATFVMVGALVAQQAKVTPLLSKDLPESAGKEGTRLTVEFAPDAGVNSHCHNPHACVYILEGSIVMQVRGGKHVMLHPGQSFYESPTHIRGVGRNMRAPRNQRNFLCSRSRIKGRRRLFRPVS